jgi:DNA adenine methylase
MAGRETPPGKETDPHHHQPPHLCYVEIFAGGGSMFFLRQPTKVEVLNDINGEVINLYRVVKNHLEEFLRQFKNALASRQIYEWSKATPPEVLTDIQRAARYLYIQKLSFGGKVTGQTFGISPSSPPRFNILRLEEDLSQAHFRLSRVCIEHLDWLTCLKKYDRDYTLHFLDPPYWQTEGYGVPFPLEEYMLMGHLKCPCTTKVSHKVSHKNTKGVRLAA